MRQLQQLATAVVLGLTFSGGLQQAAHASDDSFIASAGQGVVRVAQGQLMGFRDKGVYTFRGVPYAKATRFMPPEAPDSWNGVRLAMNYSEICPVPEQTTVSNDEQFNTHRYLPENENCQFLNVWTPSLTNVGKHPVLVFIHGGGFTNGSSIEGEGYDGRNLAELGDLVVVTLNHRLNVLGALDLSAFGPRYAQASNAGMRDVVAALKWVHANIVQFGGDPQNVTIMGQSGGGGKVRFLMGNPEAQDLFAKSIVMSGVGSIAAYPKTVGAAIAKYTVQYLGLDAKTIDRIATVPYPALLAAGEKAMKQVEKDGLAANLAWRPTIDGTFMSIDPQQEGWAKYSADKPLLIGNVLEEQTTIIGNNNSALFADNWTQWTDEQAMAKLGERFRDRAAAIAAEWKKAYPRDPLSRALFFSQANRAGSLAAAALKAKNGQAPVYLYVYKWNPPVLDGVAGAWHVADVHMALFNADRVPQSFGGGEAARSMSYDVARAWANFARAGNPGHAGLPTWPAFTPENAATMLFDDYSTVGINHDKALLDLVTRTNP
jgi:para-nitrobenzyl esterase